MLEFCAAHDIVSDIELIGAAKINEAYERPRGDVTASSSMARRFTSKGLSLRRGPFFSSTMGLACVASPYPASY